MTGFRISAKTAFVAGGSSGINLGIAKRFAREGLKVAILSRKQEKIDAALEEIRGQGAGVEAMGFAADVRDYEAVDTALRQTAELWGSVDALVSGAAGNFLAPAAALSPNGFKTVVDIDLIGTFNVMRAAYAYVTKPGASIINISAPQSFVPYPLQAHANAAKAGVDQLTRTLAIEWGPEGVRLNAIIPGPIEGTEGMARLAPTEDSAQNVIDVLPIKRMGTVEDVADLAAFLISEQASYITGTVIPVDGGMALVGTAGMVPPNLDFKALAEASAKASK